MINQTYSAEPPQYPPYSVLFGTIDQWPATLRDTVLLESTALDLAAVCFSFSLVMTGIQLYDYYKNRRLGCAVVSLMVLFVGVIGAGAVVIAADNTGAGWYAGIEFGGIAAVSLILVPALIGLTIIGLKKALRSAKRSYDDHCEIHKKNEVV